MRHHNPDDLLDDKGFFLANLLHFGRLLRRLEILVSSKQIYDLAEGVMYLDISSRDDFYHASRAFLLHDNNKLQQFNLAFDLFWSKHIKVMIELSGGREQIQHEKTDRIHEEGKTIPLDKQVITAHYNNKDELQAPDSPEIEVKPLYSPVEILYHKDFGDLNKDEIREVKALINKMVWQLGQKRTRRKIRAVKKTSYLDFRRSLRNNLSYGEEIIKLDWQRRKLKTRPLVLISDISGSMERYSQMFLYFFYALVQGFRRIETFVFGTRLTRLTPALKKKNIEAVLGDLSKIIMDWSGGTRIGDSLKEFNYRWSRRVLGHGAVVIIISDGWDRGNLDLLEREISRLRRSATRLIWLNPLAGSPDYQPLVGGIQAVLPYVDDFYPLNNLHSLEALAAKLSSIV